MKSVEEILRSSEKFKITLGLERVEKALEIFDNPQKDIDFIHVAGTNGKGSVCAIIEKILLEDKRKIVGKYTSPHLFSYTERFSVNGENICEDELEELVNLVYKKDAENKIGLSEFEILTVVCFLYFKHHNVQIGILETGLGGRLDATNVIKKPLISVVTSISYDHTERLGNTIEEIAYEKAGIFKENSKAVFLRENLGYKTLLKMAKEKKTAVLEDNIEVKITENMAIINGEEFEFNLNGDFQAENLKLALLAINALPYQIDRGVLKNALKSVKWPLRMELKEFMGQKLLLDGCHNPDGARVLTDYIKKYHKNKKIKLIFGCLENKNYKKILKTLFELNAEFCFYEFNYPNALKYVDLGEFKAKMKKTDNPIDEIRKGGYNLFVVSGSLYMLGEIFKNWY